MKLVEILFNIILPVLFIIIFPSSVILSLYYPNVILEQGISHRIFYYHVGTAWVALYAPFFGSLFGLIFLKTKNFKWDVLSASFYLTGVIFSISVIFSGAIWAKSAWGVFWDWTDARLISFTVLFISLIIYFLFRFLISAPERRAAYSAILGLFCSLNAIFTWGAIRWIENPGNHPNPVVGKGGMDPDMKTAFWISILAYHILFLIITYIFWSAIHSRHLLDRLKVEE